MPSILYGGVLFLLCFNVVFANTYVGTYEQVYRCCVAPLGVKSHKGKYDKPSVGLVEGIKYERHCPDKNHAKLCATFFDAKKPLLMPNPNPKNDAKATEWIPYPSKDDAGKALKQPLQLSIEKAHELYITLYGTEKLTYTQQQMKDIMQDHNNGEQRLFLSDQTRIKWSDVVDPDFTKVIADIGKSRADYAKELAHELEGLKQHYDATLEEISKWNKKQFEPPFFFGLALAAMACEPEQNPLLSSKRSNA